MTGAEYRAHLAALDLSIVGAARVLGVSERTGRTFASKGPSPPAAVAIRAILNMEPDPRRDFLATLRSPE